MRVGADVLQGEGWEQGLAQGKSSRAVAFLIQEVREDFLLRQRDLDPLSEHHLPCKPRGNSEGSGATGLPGLPSPEPT